MGEFVDNGDGTVTISREEYEDMLQESIWLREKNERLVGNRRENPTLRDQFAMAALPALISAENNVGWSNCARSAYEMADMMMKARLSG